ncbi:hypothetical protein ACFQ2B_12830 [Streptomyces stramineus]|uniref:Chaplin domain-containing protein n=1 Tax=Streptomyces stramineus TaxID=173861 RepID=A0ABP3LAL0_9ACTN
MNRTTAVSKKALTIATLAAAAALVTAVPAFADDHPTITHPAAVQVGDGVTADATPQDDHPTGGSDDHPTGGRDDHPTVAGAR